MSDEDLPESDAIGDTVYSKAWVLDCLLKTLQFIQSEQSTSTEADDAQQSTNFSEIEESLCHLWDISSNEHVQQMLSTHKAHQLFMNCILQTDSPRLAEICIGILANIVHNEEICQSVFSDDSFCTNVISWLSSSDIPFLTQLIRFLNMMICKKAEIAHNIITENMSQFVQDIQNLLLNCLSVEALHLLFKFINQLLYSSNEIGSRWLREDTENHCIPALCQACFQVISSFDIPDNYDSQEEWTSISRTNFDFYYNFWFIVRMLYEPEFFEAKFQPSLNELKELFHRFDYFMGDSTNAFLSYSAACAFFLLAFDALKTEPNESSFKTNISNDNSLNVTHHKVLQEYQKQESKELIEDALPVFEEFSLIFHKT